MLLRTTLLALAVAAATAASAGATPAPVRALNDDGSRATGPAPVPAVVEDDSPVTTSFKVYDADGAVTRSETCDWTGVPGDDDRACLRFQSDPWPAIEAIAADGGVRAVTHTVASKYAVDTTTSISPRDDGTWLFRSTGTADQHDVDLGLVCSPATRTCERWNASGARSAKKEIRAASARLKHQRRRHR